MQSGFVYVFSNRGLTAYKVGLSTRALYLRASELTREYGTVYPFEIASRHAVDDPASVEALTHRILARYRVPRSELFACDLATCSRAVKAAAVLVLERPWWLRCWHWVTLPHPVGSVRPGALSSGFWRWLIAVFIGGRRPGRAPGPLPAHVTSLVPFVRDPRCLSARTPPVNLGG